MASGPVGTHQAEADRLIAPGHDLGSITDRISEIVLRRHTPRGWWIGFAIAFCVFQLLLVAMGYLLFVGIKV